MGASQPTAEPSHSFQNILKQPMSLRQPWLVLVPTDVSSEELLVEPQNGGYAKRQSGNTEDKGTNDAT